MKALFRVSLTLSIVALAGCQSVADPLSPGKTASLARGPLATHVSGSGQITYLGEQRVFTLNANSGADGTVSGQMEVQNRAQDHNFHGSVVCVGSYGNVAFAGVHITDSNDPALIGVDGILTVVDNGEGAGAAPDQISLFTYSYPLATQQAWCAAGFGLAFQQSFLALYPVEGGNIQVH